ncbi:MAG: Glyoxalase/bleomycin resistance protein/dioxygenase [Segetibacter sp.]|nr:Glyoxalase/bleomycin resistance protein/dioxygenase [Segetibacter sp.]
MWHDLTIQNAAQIGEFYSKVIGWQKEGLSMGEYEDYMMKETGTGEAVAGVCHARGSNDYLPPQWLMYVLVPNLDESIEACRQL